MLLHLLIPVREYGFASTDAPQGCAWTNQAKPAGTMERLGSLQRVNGEGARASRRALAA